MPNRTKQRRSGGLTLLLYQRTLHPELFKILGSEQVSRRAYEADIWLVEGGHVITLTAGKNTLSEVIVTNHEPLTDRGLLQSIPCRGERYHEMNAGENIKYMISTQEEQLTQTLYDATTGACCDGLHPDGRNENQGAESTLSFLLALSELRQGDPNHTQERGSQGSIT
jgi:hypothetical protein